MTSTASALVQILVQHTDEEVLQALQLYISVRPGFREPAWEALQQEPIRRYSGTIATFIPHKAFGFIQSDQASVDFGKDTFVSDKEIGSFSVGDFVSFSVVVNKDNKPQARLLQSASAPAFAVPPRPPPSAAFWSPPSSAAAGAWGSSAAAAGAWGSAREPAWGEPPAKVQRVSNTPPVPPPAVLPRAAVLPRGAAAAAVLSWGAAAAGPAARGGDEGALPGRFVGVIAQFFPEKRYGFISCDVLQQRFGKDVFLSDQEVGVFSVGDAVTFSVAVKGGKPQARSLQPQGGGGGGGGGGYGGPRAPGLVAQQLINTPPPAVLPPGAMSFGGAGAMGGEDDQRYSGVIASFSSEKRFGFIQSPDSFQIYGKDVFLSDKEIGQFTVGQGVTFRVALNATGKPQARDLQTGDELAGLLAELS